MKYVVVLICIMAFNPESQAQSIPSFTGTWLVDFRTTVQNMGTDEKSAYNKLSDRARSAFTDSFKSRTFQFEEDNAVVIAFQSAGGAKRVEGSWLYDKTAKKLSVEAGGVKREFDVQWLNENRVVLTYLSIERGSLLQSLCLDRQ